MSAFDGGKHGLMLGNCDSTQFKMAPVHKEPVVSTMYIIEQSATFSEGK